jgi:hypothetical protein
MFNHPYICLDTKEDLSDGSIMCWIRCVSEAGPPGITASTETRPDNQQMSFYRRKAGDTNHYIAVLARDLSGEEATDIAKSYSDRNPEGDFLIHWSQDPVEDTKPAELAEDMVKAIALEAAKLNHNHWLRSKTNGGWRYGQKHSHRDRTSPMCRDWDGLPEDYRRKEYQRMVSLLEILDRMNLRFSRK